MDSLWFRVVCPSEFRSSSRLPFEKIRGLFINFIRAHSVVSVLGVLETRRKICFFTPPFPIIQVCLLFDLFLKFHHFGVPPTFLRKKNGGHFNPLIFFKEASVSYFLKIHYFSFTFPGVKKREMKLDIKNSVNLKLKIFVFSGGSLF